MLFQPAAEGRFYRACEADGYRGLVAALLDDQFYETASFAGRVQSRIRMAEDLALLNELEGRALHVGDRHEPDAINVHGDEEFIRSLELIGFLSLPASGA
jgi:hypothetical protein